MAGCQSTGSEVVAKVPRGSSPLIARWRRWWFPPSSGLDLAVCRIVIVGAQLFVFLPFFMASPSEQVALLELDGGFDRPQWLIRVLVAMLPPDRVSWPALVYGVYAVTIAAGMTTLVGLRTRVSALVFGAGTWFLVSHAGSYGQIQHPEVVLGSFLLFLALSPSGRRLSIDAKLGSSPAGETREAVWPLRLTQVLLAWSYFSNGTAKLLHSGLEWMNGYTLQQTLLTMALNWERPLGVWLARHHDLCAGLSVATIAFELSFPLAAFSRRARPYYLVAGTLFHLFSWFAMGVIFVQHVVLYAVFAGFEARTAGTGRHRSTVEA
jgi:hypothetical protein